MAELCVDGSQAVAHPNTINAGVTSGYLSLRGAGSFINQGRISVSRSEERRVGKRVDLGGRRIIKTQTGGKRSPTGSVATSACETVATVGRQGCTALARMT